jgi:hypothetical protein
VHGVISEAVYLWLRLFLVWPLGRVCGRPSDPPALRPGNDLLVPTLIYLDSSVVELLTFALSRLRFPGSTAKPKQQNNSNNTMKLLTFFC